MNDYRFTKTRYLSILSDRNVSLTVLIGCNFILSYPWLDSQIAEMDGVIASFVKKLSESREKETASQETIHALQLAISEAEEQNTSLKGTALNLFTLYLII